MADTPPSNIDKPNCNLENQQKPDGGDACCPLSESLPPKTETTLQTLKEEHAQATEAWRTSTTGKGFVTLFKNTVLRQEHLNLDSCICLGLGSLSAERKPGRRKLEEYNVSMSQLVALECLLELLKTKHIIKEIYFQDPDFNTLDRELLNSRGYTVIEYPASDLHITESTFLFGPGCPYFIIINAIRIAHPALLISSDLRFYCSRRLYCQEHHPQNAHSDDWNKEHNIQTPFVQIATTQPYLNQHINKPLPDAEYKWTYSDCLYYRPDNEEELEPRRIKASDYEYWLELQKAKQEDRPSDELSTAGQP